MTKLRLWAFRSAVAATAVALAVCAAISFGITPADAAKLRDFDAAVLRWQTNPDFRAVAREYVTLGVRAMQARFCGIRAKTVVLGFRSLPGLPASLAVSTTSESHYEDFSRGELPAYLHLCDEQGVEDFIPIIEELLAGQQPMSDERIVAFLRSFTMPVPVASDAGAVRSVRALLADVAATPPRFAVRNRIGAALKATAARIVPSAAGMSHLDAWLRANDPQLWRTKQVSDLLAGIWAQGYGQIYSRGIVWFFRVRLAARVLLVLLAAGLVLLCKTAAPQPSAPRVRSKARGSAAG